MDRRRDVSSRSGKKSNSRRREPDSIKKKRKRNLEDREEGRRREKRTYASEYRSRPSRDTHRKKRPAYIDDEVFEKSGFNDIENKKSIRSDDNNISRDIEHNSETTKRNKSLRHKKRLTLKNIKRGILVVLGVIIVYIAYILIGFFNNVQIDDSFAATNPSRGESVNILLLGTDIGDVNQTDNQSLKRTDTIMLLNYNPNNKKTQVVSIPRDTLVQMNGQNMKINAVFQNGGNASVSSVVEDMLDITINYVMDIDYEAFRQFIDAIGGIDMEIEYNMDYDDDGQNLHIHFTKGTTEHLDGQKAEEFFRWRKNNDGTGFATGDIGRIENQHKFLQKVVDKCKSPTILFKAPKILNAVATNMTTNMKGSKMVRYGLGIMRSMKNGINMTTIAGTPQYINGISYLIYDESANAELIASLKGSSSDDDDELSRKKASVLILNCTNTSGLAAQTKSKLASAGFENIEVDNGSSLDKSKVMTKYDNLQQEVMEILPKVKESEGKSSDYPKYDVVIMLGQDYIE